MPRRASLAYRASLGSSNDPPLMLLHGLGMTADLNWGATYPELRRLFRVVAPDLPGHGRGVRPWPKFSLEKCADHIVALADSLEIDRFIACGFSMGSLVAQLIWRRHPDRVSALVLGATSRNFLGSPAERLISSLSPAFTVAARTNPLLRSLSTNAFGTGYLTDIVGESRRTTRRNESDQYVDGYCGARGCRGLHLTPMDRRYRCPSVGPGNDEGLGRATRQADETGRHDTARHSRHRRGRSRRVHRVTEAVHREDSGSVSRGEAAPPRNRRVLPWRPS